MNRQTIQGGAEKVSGKVKEAAGNATDNERLASEGRAEQVKGGVRQAAGKVKDAASDAADYVRSEK
ncbi:MAG TPA: CsbD family protein [Acidobacteriaceae bacterium]|nr:CsbD family protein [Acidobacteriaceae bacterium]